MLPCDVGFSIQVPKLLLNLGLEEPLVHGSAQITDRGMVSVPFPHLCSFNTFCAPFANSFPLLEVQLSSEVWNYNVGDTAQSRLIGLPMDSWLSVAVLGKIFGKNVW